MTDCQVCTRHHPDATSHRLRRYRRLRDYLAQQREVRG